MDSLSTLGSHSQYVPPFPYVIRKIVWNGVDGYGSNMFKLTFTKKVQKIMISFHIKRRPAMCGSGTVARSLNHEASLVFAWAMFWSKGGAKIGPEGLRDVVCSASGCVTLLIDNWRVQMRSKIPVKSLGWLHDLIWCCFHVELGWGLVETSYLRSPGMNHSGATTSLNWIAEEMPRWISTSTLPAMIFSGNRQIWQQSNMIRRHVHMVRFRKLMRFF